MIDLFYVYCIDKKDLQEIAKTAVVGLQKLKYPIFLCLFFTNTLRRKWTHQVYGIKLSRKVWNSVKLNVLWRH